jgi:hypothetical protein
MPQQDEPSTVQRRLDDLCRVAPRLEDPLANSLDMRRVHAGTRPLRDSLTLLRESAPRTAAAKRPEPVTIPDAPYDPKLRSGAEDEGPGSPYGHSP